MVGIQVSKVLNLNKAAKTAKPFHKYQMSVIVKSKPKSSVHACILFYLCREPEVEEVKEPVDPAVRAKENWLRLFNKVRQQLQEVGL